MARIILRSAPDRFAIAGHSMGGRVALEVYRQSPERVHCLALLDTGYRARLTNGDGDQEVSHRRSLLDLAHRKGMRAAAEQWIPPMIHPDRLNDRALLDSIVAMVLRKTPEIFAAQVTALLDRPEAGPLLSLIKCPTLVLCGRQDSWSPYIQHEEIAAAIEKSALVVIERCGHMSTMERSTEVSGALAEWFYRSVKH